MDFGQAIANLKAGAFVQREGWNGKGMFLYLTKGVDIPANQLRQRAADAHEAYTHRPVSDDEVTICDHIDMRAADGTIVVGWLASQTDMLADDWRVYEPV